MITNSTLVNSTLTNIASSWNWASNKAGIVTEFFMRKACYTSTIGWCANLTATDTLENNRVQCLKDLLKGIRGSSSSCIEMIRQGGEKEIVNIYTTLESATSSAYSLYTKASMPTTLDSLHRFFKTRVEPFASPQNIAIFATAAVVIGVTLITLLACGKRKNRGDT